jgi:hypothetical protein
MLVSSMEKISNLYLELRHIEFDDGRQWQDAIARNYLYRLVYISDRA